ncbi:MAG: hypothetical protein HRT74_04565 [Flavobacteriales bacterium]|nr:hypothetical protein [Flavobacteriales bacterium]
MLSDFAIDCFVMNSQDIPQGDEYNQTISGGRAEVLKGYLWSPIGTTVFPQPHIHANQTLAHEIGHCLGLQHVNDNNGEPNFFGTPGCIELANADEWNSANCGDMVSDTPAYPHGVPGQGLPTYDEELEQCFISECIDPCSPEECEYCYDESNEPFETEINNLMWHGGTNLLCNLGLTSGQGEKIREYANQYNLTANYLVPDQSADNYSEYLIQEDQQFLNEELYMSSMVLHGGNAVFENCTLFMEQDAFIELSPTSSLTMINCQLLTKKGCQNITTWRGISMRKGFNHWNNNYVELNPELIMENCEIRDAEFAISNTTFPNSYTSFEFSPLTFDSGGVISLNNCNLYNNAYDLVYISGVPQSLESECIVTDCNFGIDGGFPFTTSKVANIFNKTGPNLELYGCQFTIRDRDTLSFGIQSIGGGFIVDSSVNRSSNFTNYYYGIHASQTNGINVITINECEFENNFRSVYLDGTLFSTVTNCSFDREPEMDLTMLDEVDLNDPFGYEIYLNSCDAFTVNRNNFDANPEELIFDPANYDYVYYGLIINNSGNSSNLIELNTFREYVRPVVALNNNLWTGIGSTGLSFRCNEFAKCLDRLVWITKDFEWDDPFGISQFQGEPTESAGNRFSTYDHEYEFYNALCY